MNRSTPDLPVQHQLLEFTQTHVHRVSDAIQPSHPLSSPSPPAPNPSQHQSFPMSQLFVWGSQSIGVSTLASFQRNPRADHLQNELVGSPCKSWKMMLWKCCTQYASKFGKLSHGHRTGKDQFSFQSQRKAMPKNWCFWTVVLEKTLESPLDCKEIQPVHPKGD